MGTGGPDPGYLYTQPSVGPGKLLSAIEEELVRSQRAEELEHARKLGEAKPWWADGVSMKWKDEATPLSEQRCENCLFWFFMAEGSGLCRRSPPQVLSDYEAVHPESKYSWWCGEWRVVPKSGGPAQEKLNA